jgi:hypothetical protein
MLNTNKKATKAQAEKLFTLRSQQNAMMTAAEIHQAAGHQADADALLDRMQVNQDKQFKLLVRITGTSYQQVVDTYHNRTTAAPCQLNGKVIAGRYPVAVAA